MVHYLKDIGMRRVVVSGLGTVCPLGTHTKQAWDALLHGESGIIKLPAANLNRPSLEDAVLESLPSRIAGIVPQYTSAFASHTSGMPLSVQFACDAAKQALEDAKVVDAVTGEWTANAPSKELVGVSIGNGMGSLEEVKDALKKLEIPRGYRKISPYFVPRILANIPAGYVSLLFGLCGPNHAVSTACASGAHSIGDAFRFIKDGYADIMVCGGTEASINSLSIAGFSRCMALSTKWNDEPSKASRPFDQKRDGFVIAEGAGILVLEEYESAKKRIGEEGIYAEILGYGLSGDAYHLTAPDPNASGAIRAMKGALRNFDPRKVDYVNAHATSTPLGDQLEARAISQVFNESSSVSVSSTKGSTGHLLGAAGALEAIFTILSVKHDILPHTLNLHSLDLEVETLPNLAFIRDQPEQKLINSALSNSFGFGGTNASLSFGKLCKNNAV